MSFSHIIGAVMLAIFIIFILQNMASVNVNFLVFEISMPRALLLSLTLLIGVLIGIFLPFELQRKRKK